VDVFYWLIAGGIVAVAVAALAIPWLVRRRRLAQLSQARQLFHQQRERLEARFLDMAANSGRPRGLAWTNCDFEDEITFAHDRSTGELTALVGVTISFEAVEGGGMEEVEAVGNLRAATAVFRYRASGWATDGRAIFNLEPNEAVEHFRGTLERIAE